MNRNAFLKSNCPPTVTDLGNRLPKNVKTTNRWISLQANVIGIFNLMIKSAYRRLIVQNTPSPSSERENANHWRALFPCWRVCAPQFKVARPGLNVGAQP